MINWFSRNKITPIATINQNGIVINKPGRDLLEKAYAVKLGIDTEKKEIVIRPLSVDEAESPAIDPDDVFPLTGGKSYTRISSRAFTSYLSILTKKDYSEPKKYLCSYEEKENYFYVELDKEVEGL